MINRLILRIQILSIFPGRLIQRIVLPLLIKVITFVPLIISSHV